MLLVCLSLITPIAYGETQINLRSEYEQWNAGLGGEVDGILLGASAGQQLAGPLFYGAGLVAGKYRIDGQQQNDLYRGDLDAVVGFHLTRHISLFGGYRLVLIDYNNTDDAMLSFNDMTHGIGMGVSSQLMFGNKLLGYARLSLSGLYSNLSFSFDQADNDGLGFSAGSEVGTAYQFTQRTSIGISVKYQHSVIRYDNDLNPWAHNYFRVGLNLNQSF